MASYPCAFRLAEKISRVSLRIIAGTGFRGINEEILFIIFRKTMSFTF